MPYILGILNVTPDSFSDGGLFLGLDAALKQAEKLIADGADCLDIGGESTRPGSEWISAQEEVDRVLPVVEQIRKRFDVSISIDTTKQQVLKEALNFNVQILNDVSGGKNTDLLKIAAASNLKIILMHSQAQPKTMQNNPVYPLGVVEEVILFLKQQVEYVQSLGVSLEKIWVDPGIGFGKTLEHNLLLLKQIKKLTGLAGNVVIGTSRKSFISKILDPKILKPEEREPGTLSSNLWAYSLGVQVFRVHDVAALKQALATWIAIEKST